MSASKKASKRRRERSQSKKARDRSSSSSTELRWLVGILACAALLRLIYLSGAIGGFHAFNEANYLLIARNLSLATLLSPTPDGQYIFLETPPLFSYLLKLAQVLFGSSVFVGRLLSVVASVVTVYIVFRLARRGCGQDGALAAAAIVAVAPVFVLVGRNIQTDALYLALLLGGLALYLRAREQDERDRSRSRRPWILTGALLGLSLFTKLFGVVLAPALLAWEWLSTRSLAVLKKGDVWLGVAVAGLLPLSFYGYHFLRDASGTSRDVFGGAASETFVPTRWSEWSGLLIEAWWAFSPLIALFCVAALWSSRKALRGDGDRLLWMCCASAYALFYVVAHKHSYYLLTLLAFLALLVGKWVDDLRKPEARRLVLFAILLSGGLTSLVDLTSMKLGYREFAQLAEHPAVQRGAPIAASSQLLDSHRRVLQYYAPESQLFALEHARAGAAGTLQIPHRDLHLLAFRRFDQEPVDGRLVTFSRTRYGLSLFGRVYAEAHPNPNFFRHGPSQFHRGGPPIGLGRIAEAPILGLAPVPADQMLVRRGGRVSLAPRSSAGGR